MTPAIVAALETIRLLRLDLGDGDNDTKYSLDQPAVGDPIGHAQIIAISKLLRNQDSSVVKSSMSYHLDQLLRGSRICSEPPKPKAEPTSTYLNLMARLRQEEQNLAYERMINPPPPSETFAQRFPTSSYAKLFPTASKMEPDEDDEITYADINRQMALIINILVSVAACSVAIWMASSQWSTPKRLGLSMGGSGMIGVGEVVVYAGYLRRLKEARESGKKHVEVKEIIKTWVIGGTTEEIHKEAKAIETNLPKDNNIRRRRAL